ncbi:MAG: flagellar motor protein [Chromatiales bacterium]|jgi:chemotaxis protein MotA|nr:flagellar motor protein [Chromatiales bacterium]
MDILSIVGILLSAIAILGGQILEGGHIGSLFNGPALLIVFGGTLGAILLQTPLPVFIASMRRLVWIVVPPEISLQRSLDTVVEWGEHARRNGLLSLEEFAEHEPRVFARKGLQLLVDGTEPDVIRRTLAVDIDSREAFGIQVAKVFEGMGGYAPTIGIIGAVLGLIHVMENLADPSKLGSGIAAAFVATVYGVGTANLIYLPIANKLKSINQAQAQNNEMLVDGMIAIAEGENPRSIRIKLESYLV